MELKKFSEELEKIVIDTVESGIMTKDLAALVSPNQSYVSTLGFLEKIDVKLNKSLNF